MSMARRILVIQLFQETHGFSPMLTPLNAFEVEEGEEVLIKNAEADSVLGGIIRELVGQGNIAIGGLAARASCGGKLKDDAYANLRQAVLETVRSLNYDAIALDLHGCTQSESLDSVEEDILLAIREITGSEMPIVAGFDLHAHATRKVFSLLDYGTAYKTNPHSDAVETGTRVAQVLNGILTGEMTPKGLFLSLPMLLSGNDETKVGPLSELHGTMRQAVTCHPDLLDYSIFNVNPFIDGEEIGQAILVYAKTSHGVEAARDLVVQVASEFWRMREEFVHQLPTVTDLLNENHGKSARLIIGDFGDRVLAGAPGDSVYVLNECLVRTDSHITAIVTDQYALASCVKAGEGAEVSIPVGAKWTDTLEHMVVSGTIRRIGEGVFRNRGTFMKGALLRIGPYAVIENERYTLLVTHDAVMSQDPGCFLDAGISLDNTDIIIVKSGYHFKMAFQDYGLCAIAETPGLSGFHPEVLPFEKCRPIYPLDSIERPFSDVILLQ